MGFLAQSRRSLLHVSALVSVLFVGLDGAEIIPVPQTQLATQTTTLQDAPMLSGVDKAHYRQAFMLQRTGNIAESDRELAATGNRMLVGTVLGERYLAKHFMPRYSELSAWLSEHMDLPAAEAVYHLAMSHKPAQAAAIEEPGNPKSSKNYNNGYAKSALHENKSWNAGLAAFRRHDMNVAARNFRLLADGDNGLISDDRAAAAFWAYRSLQAAGDVATANKYLDKAADAPSGFYSLLARSLTNENQSVTPAIAQEQMAAVTDQLPVKRAIALKELGENRLAEAELKALYAKSPKVTRTCLLALARQLDMSSLSLRMAVMTSAGKESFPMPDWQPTSGYQVERALLFAFMRQESGFNPNAHSASGAVGLMQLMPATAYAMAHQNRQFGESLDPSVNMTLGQRYVEHLMSAPHIGDNLIFLTAAYNAGPGAVAGWLHNGHAEKDPLLFVETLPYAQTREYVTHVVTNYWIYSQLMGVEQPTSLAALASGEWPRYEGAERQLVAMLNRAD